MLHLFAPLMLVVAAAAAQTFTTFSRSLADPLGAALPGVRVTLSSADRHAKYEVQSSRTGQFEFVGLRPGDYVLEAQHPGFQPFRGAIALSGQPVQRAITLQIGSLQETVTVVEDYGAGGGPVQVGTPRSNPPCPGSTAAGDVPVGGNIRPPKRISDARPHYPAGLHGTGVDAIVVLDGRIGLDGFMKDVKIQEPANPDFAQALVSAVQYWQWDSTLLNCVPMEVSIRVTGKFLHRQ